MLRTITLLLGVAVFATAPALGTAERQQARFRALCGHGPSVSQYWVGPCRQTMADARRDAVAHDRRAHGGNRRAQALYNPPGFRCVR